MNPTLSSAVNAVLPLLALAGAGALGFRLLRSLLRLGIAAAEATAVAGLIDVSARRGDLTALAERRQHAQGIRRMRRTSMAAVVVWLGILVVPVAIGFAREAFAASSLLWLFPTRPLRLAPPPEAE